MLDKGKKFKPCGIYLILLTFFNRLTIAQSKPTRYLCIINLKQETMTATNTTPKKFDLSAIFKRAWNFVRTLAVSISEALKQAWAEAKTGIGAMAVVAPPGEPAFEIKCGSKQSKPATYEQYRYLLTFPNVEMNCSGSSFTTRISRRDASDAIDEAKSGRKVIINR